MGKHPAIPILVALHGELAGKRLECREEAKRLQEAMKHVEAVIKLCDPDYSLARIAVRPRTGPIRGASGHMFRAVLDTFKAATEPLPTRQVAARMLVARGMAKPSGRDISRLEVSVRGALRDGLANHLIADNSKPPKWRLIPDT